MARIALKDVTIDRVRAHRVEWGMKATKGPLSLQTAAVGHRVEAALIVIHVREGIGLNVAACAVGGVGEACHALVAESHVDQCLLIVEAAVVIHLLALQLILDALAVWGIADKGQDRSDAVNEKSTLGRFGIIEGRLRGNA